MTPKELALALDTTDREVRKFLRSRHSGIAADAPGKGGRWAIDARKVKGLKGKFAKWDIARRDAEGKVTTDDPTPDATDADAPPAPDAD